MTWYQKGLESSLYSWQTLTTMLENNDNQHMFDILGRLTFVQFCVEQMLQENKVYAADDLDYFLAVLYKIQQLLMMISHSSITQDFGICADALIISIQEKLILYPQFSFHSKPGSPSERIEDGVEQAQDERKETITIKKAPIMGPLKFK
jgi:hypothetical protein